MQISGISTVKYNKTPYESGIRTRRNKSAETVFTKRTKLNNKKITYSEGKKIFLNGIKTQFTDTLTMLCSPKALTGIAGFIIALSFLPIINIPVSAAGGVLALGFGAAALARTAKHTINFIKNNKNGAYAKARKDLEKIGGDSVDLALSLPFAPKAVLKTGQFVKYGKIGFNKSFAECPVPEKFFRLTWSGKANAELERKLCYNKAADAEIKALKNLSETEAARIKQNITDYNIADEQIPEVVLDKWAKSHGISAKPDWEYRTLAKGTAGYASIDDCTIVLNDYKTTVEPPARFVLLQKTQAGENYRFSYWDTKENTRIEEIVSKKIIDENDRLSAIFNASSPQLQRILTTIHEREHIDQYARIIMIKGNKALYQTPTRTALELYHRMIKDIAACGSSPEKSQEIAQIISTLNNPKNGTFAEYIKRPIEIGARKAETEALKDPFYKHLDNIYKQVNANIPKNNNGRTAVLNTVRADSMAS